MDPPTPGAVRYIVLEALASGHQTQWTTAQVVAYVESSRSMLSAVLLDKFDVELVGRALASLETDQLVRPLAWAKTDPLYMITDGGRALLARGAQLQLTT